MRVNKLKPLCSVTSMTLYDLDDGVAMDNIKIKDDGGVENIELPGLTINEDPNLSTFKGSGFPQSLREPWVVGKGRTITGIPMHATASPILNLYSNNENESVELRTLAQAYRKDPQAGTSISYMQGEGTGKSVGRTPYAFVDLDTMKMISGSSAIPAGDSTYGSNDSYNSIRRFQILYEDSSFVYLLGYNVKYSSTSTSQQYNGVMKVDKATFTVAAFTSSAVGGNVASFNLIGFTDEYIVGSYEIFSSVSSSQATGTYGPSDRICVINKSTLEMIYQGTTFNLDLGGSGNAALQGNYTLFSDNVNRAFLEDEGYLYVYRTTLNHGSSSGLNTLCSISDITVRIDTYNKTTKQWAYSTRNITWEDSEGNTRFDLASLPEGNPTLPSLFTALPHTFSGTTTANSLMSVWSKVIETDGVPYLHFAVIPSNINENPNKFRPVMAQAVLDLSDRTLPTLLSSSVVEEGISHTSSWRGASTFMYDEDAKELLLQGTDYLYRMKLNGNKLFEHTMAYHIPGMILTYKRPNGTLLSLTESRKLYRIDKQKLRSAYFEFESDVFDYEGPTSQAYANVGLMDGDGNYQVGKIRVTLTGDAIFPSGSRTMDVVTLATGPSRIAMNLVGVGPVSAAVSEVA